MNQTFLIKIVFIACAMIMPLSWSMYRPAASNYSFVRLIQNQTLEEQIGKDKSVHSIEKTDEEINKDSLIDPLEYLSDDVFFQVLQYVHYPVFRYNQPILKKLMQLCRVNKKWRTVVHKYIQRAFLPQDMILPISCGENRNDIVTQQAYSGPHKLMDSISYQVDERWFFALSLSHETSSREAVKIIEVWQANEDCSFTLVQKITSLNQLPLEVISCLSCVMLNGISYIVFGGYQGMQLTLNIMRACENGELVLVHTAPGDLLHNCTAIDMSGVGYIICSLCGGGVSAYQSDQYGKFSLVETSISKKSRSFMELLNVLIDSASQEVFESEKQLQDDQFYPDIFTSVHISGAWYLVGGCADGALGVWQVSRDGLFSLRQKITAEHVFDQFPVSALVSTQAHGKHYVIVGFEKGKIQVWQVDQDGTLFLTYQNKAPRKEILEFACMQMDHGAYVVSSCESCLEVWKLNPDGRLERMQIFAQTARCNLRTLVRLGKLPYVLLGDDKGAMCLWNPLYDMVYSDYSHQQALFLAQMEGLLFSSSEEAGYGKKKIIEAMQLLEQLPSKAQTNMNSHFPGLVQTYQDFCSQKLNKTKEDDFDDYWCSIM